MGALSPQALDTHNHLYTTGNHHHHRSNLRSVWQRYRFTTPDQLMTRGRRSPIGHVNTPSIMHGDFKPVRNPLCYIGTVGCVHFMGIPDFAKNRSIQSVVVSENVYNTGIIFSPRQNCTNRIFSWKYYITSGRNQAESGITAKSTPFGDKSRIFQSSL